MNRINFDTMLDDSNFGPIVAVRTLFRGEQDLLPSSFGPSSKPFEFAESRLIQSSRTHPMFFG